MIFKRGRPKKSGEAFRRRFVAPSTAPTPRPSLPFSRFRFWNLASAPERPWYPIERFRWQPTPPPPPIKGLVSQAVKETLVQGASDARISQTVAEILGQGPASARVSQVVSEILTRSLSWPSNARVSQTVVEYLLPILPSAAIAAFPSLPVGFPVKVTPIMKTTIGISSSGREVRWPNQPYPLWEFELPFEVLRDQTQNQTPYAPLLNFTDYMQLCQFWLQMNGKTNLFYFDAPWDDSRFNEQIGVGDGSTRTFTFYRTWGINGISLAEPIGGLNGTPTVYIDGVPTTAFALDRNTITFNSAPATNAVITATFNFFYLCRFVADNQDFEEFFKNIWAVKSLKFRSVYWPPASATAIIPGGTGGGGGGGGATTKLYFEITTNLVPPWPSGGWNVTPFGPITFGLCDGSFLLSNPGQDILPADPGHIYGSLVGSIPSGTQNAGYWNNSGVGTFLGPTGWIVDNSGTGGPIGAPPVAGHTYGIAIDLSTLLIEFRDWSDPTQGWIPASPGVNGFSASAFASLSNFYFAVSLIYYVGVSQVTLNAGATTFVGQIPNGYSALSAAFGPVTWGGTGSGLTLSNGNLTVSADSSYTPLQMFTAKLSTSFIPK